MKETIARKSRVIILGEPAKERDKQTRKTTHLNYYCSQPLQVHLSANRIDLTSSGAKLFNCLLPRCPAIMKFDLLAAYQIIFFLSPDISPSCIRLRIDNVWLPDSTSSNIPILLLWLYRDLARKSLYEFQLLVDTCQKTVKKEGRSRILAYQIQLSLLCT